MLLRLLFTHRGILSFVLAGLLASGSAYADPPRVPWWKRMFVLPYAKVEKLVLKPPPAIQAKVPLTALATEIPGRIDRVMEFAWVREWAAKNGVKIYLFGGTASAYAHYVHGDLLREAGDKRYQAARYDYDYTNVFRSTQDLDLVVDGTAEQANDLQNALMKKFAYLQGQKSQWEVRTLRSSLGDKEALLDNPNFLNQHSDSNSTGLIEISRSSDPPIRDLRDWDSGVKNQFLRDVHEFKLHYYWSRLHSSTARAKKGLNPPIISVVRALTKAFQYELELDDESVKTLSREVEKFRAAKLSGDPYVKNWLHKNAPKLIQNAVNIEYAVETMNTLGLLDKLASIGDPKEVDSMAWWLRKKPLGTKAVGAGSGATAAELGIDIVSHETNSFLAYESITKAHTGDPNVLSSRTNVDGEAAVFGEGFYTRKGMEGARGTGITVRFRVDPNARAGHDFTVHDDYIVFKNKAAFKVIPESLALSPLDLIERVESGLVTINKKIDLALLEKFKRRIRPRIALSDPGERASILKRFQAQLAKSAPDKEALNLYLDLFAADPNYAEIWTLLHQKIVNLAPTMEIGDLWLGFSDEIRQKFGGPEATRAAGKNAYFAEVTRVQDLQVQKIMNGQEFGSAIRQAALKQGRFTRVSGTYKMPLHSDDIWLKVMEKGDDPLNLLFLIESHDREFFTHGLSLSKWVEHSASLDIAKVGIDMIGMKSAMWKMEFLHGFGGWGHHPKAMGLLDYFFEKYLPAHHDADTLREMTAGRAAGGYLNGVASDLDYWMLQRQREYVGSREFRKPATWLDHPELLEICKPGPVTGACILRYYLSGKRFSAERLFDPCREILQAPKK